MRDFALSRPSILISVSRSVVTGSDESVWDCVIDEFVSPHPFAVMQMNVSCALY